MKWLYYKCYTQTDKKPMIFQCKSFLERKEANVYKYEDEKKVLNTIVIPVCGYMPKMMHRWFLKKSI
jgi:hypothetical protein